MQAALDLLGVAQAYTRGRAAEMLALAWPESAELVAPLCEASNFDAWRVVALASESGATVPESLTGTALRLGVASTVSGDLAWQLLRVLTSLGDTAAEALRNLSLHGDDEVAVNACDAMGVHAFKAEQRARLAAAAGRHQVLAQALLVESGEIQLSACIEAMRINTPWSARLADALSSRLNRDQADTLFRRLKPRLPGLLSVHGLLGVYAAAGRAADARTMLRRATASRRAPIAAAAAERYLRVCSDDEVDSFLLDVTGRAARNPWLRCAIAAGLAERCPGEAWLQKHREDPDEDVRNEVELALTHRSRATGGADSANKA